RGAVLLARDEHGPVRALDVALRRPAARDAAGLGGVEDEEAAGDERARDALEERVQRARVPVPRRRVVEQVVDTLPDRANRRALRQLATEQGVAHEARARRALPCQREEGLRLIDAEHRAGAVELLREDPAAAAEVDDEP